MPKTKKKPSGKIINLLPEGMPDKITGEVTITGMTGLPFFYTEVIDGSIGTGKNKARFSVSMGLNGGAMYIAVGSARYALPMREVMDKFVNAIYHSLLESDNLKPKS